LLELIEISGTRSANNARLSEYVLWRNRYAQSEPLFFDVAVHPEYIDKAKDVDKESEQDFKKEAARAPNQGSSI
jgi:hypothetical protein